MRRNLVIYYFPFVLKNEVLRLCNKKLEKFNNLFSNFRQVLYLYENIENSQKNYI